MRIAVPNFEKYTLREKCPNTELFLVRYFRVISGHLSLSDRVITFTLLVTLEAVQMLGKKSCLILPATLLKTELFRRYFSRINVNFSGATILSNTSEWLALYLSLLLFGHILVKA